MLVDWAIPCRFTEVHDNLATVVGGGIDHLWPPALPAPIGIMIAVRIVFTADELESDEEHQLRVVANAPSGGALNQAEGTFRVGRGLSELAEDELHGVHVPMVIQFPAETEGRYSLDITINNAHTVNVPLHVAVGPPPGQAPPPE